MVIVNSIDAKYKNTNMEAAKAKQFVYLIDDEQQMMLILKRDLTEISGNDSEDESVPIQDLVTKKIQGLLERVTGCGPLSTREMEILNYAAMGTSNKRIAEILGISESTVKNHFSSTLRKLHANDRTHAVTLALCNGWIDVKHVSKETCSKNLALTATI